MTENAEMQIDLMLGAWRPDVHALWSPPKNTVSIAQIRSRPPPARSHDCDGTLHNDVGEAMMRYMVTRRLIQSDRGFWGSSLERMAATPSMLLIRRWRPRDSEVYDTAAYRRYRAGHLGYMRTCAGAG